MFDTTHYIPHSCIQKHVRITGFVLVFLSVMTRTGSEEPNLGSSTSAFARAIIVRGNGTWTHSTIQQFFISSDSPADLPWYTLHFDLS